MYCKACFHSNCTMEGIPKCLCLSQISGNTSFCGYYHVSIPTIIGFSLNILMHIKLGYMLAFVACFVLKCNTFLEYI